VPTVVAVAAGAVFVSFGAGHLTNHASDVGDFRRYQVPLPSPAAWGVGLVEVTAGLALILGLLVRPAATLLAGDMIGVVATAGRVEGGFLNLVIAPLLFVAMVFLVWAGPGALGLDRVLARRKAGPIRGRPPR
jgi:putative oxidoreductase